MANRLLEPTRGKQGWGCSGQLDGYSTRTFTLPHQTDSEAAILKEWWVVQDNSAFGLALAGHHRSDVVSLRETRTFTVLILYDSLSQPFAKNGGSCRIRTCDQLIKSQLLYQLS